MFRELAWSYEEDIYKYCDSKWQCSKHLTLNNVECKLNNSPAEVAAPHRPDLRGPPAYFAAPISTCLTFAIARLFMAGLLRVVTRHVLH
jgi:hypothetical protein